MDNGEQIRPIHVQLADIKDMLERVPVYPGLMFCVSYGAVLTVTSTRRELFDMHRACGMEIHWIANRFIQSRQRARLLVAAQRAAASSRYPVARYPVASLISNSRKDTRRRAFFAAV